MKYNWRRTLVLAMACLLSATGYSEAGAGATYGGPARLIVYRTPTTGKFVFVDVYVDDVAVGGIAYGGRNCEALLKPGRHILSALATPRPQWWERPPTIVNMRSGETYKFSAVSNGQGNLILRPMD